MEVLTEPCGSLNPSCMDSECIHAMAMCAPTGKAFRMSIVALTLLALTGCASIAKSVVEYAVDAASCNNECPGGPGEKECIERCRNRLAEIRKENQRTKKDQGFWPEQGYQYQPPQLPAGLRRSPQ